MTGVTQPSPIERAAARNATTLCRCWRIERVDGTTLGFTDHDEPLAFDGVDYAAATGIDGAVADASMGLDVEDAEIAGALDHGGLDADDLARGLYDNAEVALFVVDWTNVEARSRLATYVVGEVTRAGGAFRAELRGLTQLLDRPTARRFRRECDAELGDRRCGVDLAAAGRTVEAEVTGLVEGTIVLDASASEDFAHGTLEWLSGANAGSRTRIAAASVQDDALILRPWRPADRPVAVGDRVRATVGCDKSLAACRDRFANALNHRGFPHLPGNDFAFSYASSDAVHDGRPLVE